MNNVWHMFCMLFLFALHGGATTSNLPLHNARLAKTNKVLLNALYSLSAEAQVGMEKRVGGSGCSNQEAKSCTGTKLKLSDFNRENMSGEGAYTLGEGWCEKQCEYYGLNGCCQYDSDTNDCWFSRTGSVVDDDFSEQVLVSELGAWPMEWGTNYKRHSGMCTWSGEHKMIVHARKAACKWNGADKDGQKQKSGTSESGCTAFCIDNDDCVFAEFKSGTCRIYKTCSYGNSADTNDNGYKIWQKVRSDAPTTWVDDRWGEYDCDARCAHNKQWIGDGGCDAYMCGGCDFWFKDGEMDGGDCAGW